MIWNIAQAKQQFSEVVRLSVQEPQAIYNRDKAVAVLINAEQYASFQQWHTAQHEPSLSMQFAELRSAMQQEGVDALQLPDRSTVQRQNAFVQMLDAEAAARPPVAN